MQIFRLKFENITASSKEEEEKWRTKDPITRFANWLTHKGWFNEQDNEKRLTAMRQEVLASMKRCETTEICPIDDIVSDVYDSVPWHLDEQLQDLKQHIKKYPHMYPKTSGRMK